MLQTKHCILQSKYGTQNPNQIDQCITEQDAAQLDTNTCKITLRHAARASRTGVSKRGESTAAVKRCRTARCVCKGNGVGCTTYYHKRSGECPNKAEGSAHTQIAVIEQEQVNNDEM